jgi:hypothetical protein
MQAPCHSAGEQIAPPIAAQVCSTSGPVTLNHGTLVGTEQADVLSSVVPAGAEVT